MKRGQVDAVSTSDAVGSRIPLFRRKYDCKMNRDLKKVHAAKW